jgi:hypothetical protein
MDINAPENQKTIAWLLESPTPSIRYLTLTGVLGKPENDPEVQTARLSIASESPVSHILEKQAPEGYWQYARHYYSPKYRSSHWSMLLLSELGLDPKHPAMQQGAAFMQACFEDDKRLQNTQPPYWGCLWGNALRYHLYAGNPHEEFIQRMLDFVVSDLQQLSRCRYNDGLPCAWGVVRDLYGLALLPAEKRSTQINEAILEGLKFMLEDFDLLAADYPHIEKIHPTWSKLSFPLFYQADVPFVLRVAKELGALHYPQAQSGLKWLADQRHQNGTWSGGSPYRQRTWPILARGDVVNRWITLQAMRVLV